MFGPWLASFVIWRTYGLASASYFKNAIRMITGILPFYLVPNPSFPLSHRDTVCSYQNPKSTANFQGILSLASGASRPRDLKTPDSAPPHAPFDRSSRPLSWRPFDASSPPSGWPPRIVHAVETRPDKTSRHLSCVAATGVVRHRRRGASSFIPSVVESLEFSFVSISIFCFGTGT